VAGLTNQAATIYSKREGFLVVYLFLFFNLNERPHDQSGGRVGVALDSSVNVLWIFSFSGFVNEAYP